MRKEQEVGGRVWESERGRKMTKMRKNKIKGEKEREKSVSGLRVEENVGKKWA